MDSNINGNSSQIEPANMETMLNSYRRLEEEQWKEKKEIQLRLIQCEEEKHQLKLEILNLKFANLPLMFPEVNQVLNRISDRIDGIGDRIDGIAYRIDGIADRIDGIELDISQLKDRLQPQEQQDNYRSSGHISPPSLDFPNEPMLNDISGRYNQEGSLVEGQSALNSNQQVDLVSQNDSGDNLPIIDQQDEQKRQFGDNNSNLMGPEVRPQNMLDLHANEEYPNEELAPGSEELDVPLPNGEDVIVNGSEQQPQPQPIKLEEVEEQLPSTSCDANSMLANVTPSNIEPGMGMPIRSAFSMPTKRKNANLPENEAKKAAVSIIEIKDEPSDDLTEQNISRESRYSSNGGDTTESAEEENRRATASAGRLVLSQVPGICSSMSIQQQLQLRSVRPSARLLQVNQVGTGSSKPIYSISTSNGQFQFRPIVGNGASGVSLNSAPLHTFQSPQPAVSNTSIGNPQARNSKPLIIMSSSPQSLNQMVNIRGQSVNLRAFSRQNLDLTRSIRISRLPSK